MILRILFRVWFQGHEKRTPDVPSSKLRYKPCFCEIRKDPISNGDRLFDIFDIVSICEEGFVLDAFSGARTTHESSRYLKA